MNIDLIEELAENIKGIDTLTEWQRAKIAITADLMLKLADELKECQDQRRAAFRRIEELDRELQALRAQIGQGVPVAWLVCSVNKDGSLSLEHAAAWQEAAHEHINDAITEHGIADAASWVVRPAYTHTAPQQKPHTA